MLLNCVCEHLCFISIYFVCLLVSESESRSVVSDSLQPHGLYSPWNSPGQKTGVDNLSLLQGIFPTQGLNPGLPHCRQILYQLSHKGSPRILEWVAYPFSRRSSWPRNRTRVSCIAGGFFTNWVIREAPKYSPCTILTPYSLIKVVNFKKTWHGWNWQFTLNVYNIPIVYAHWTITL